MSISAVVRRIAGKRLEATARQHIVITDRPPAEGGEDRGCTSGELLLMAIGSCATGSLRNFLEAHEAPVEGLETRVALAPSSTPGACDKLVLAVTLPRGADRFDDETLRTAATSGGVVSRLQAGSEIEVRVERV
jgi:uncharacterized OsmC-like protein